MMLVEANRLMSDNGGKLDGMLSGGIGNYAQMILLFSLILLLVMYGNSIRSGRVAAGRWGWGKETSFRE